MDDVVDLDGGILQGLLGLLGGRVGTDVCGGMLAALSNFCLAPTRSSQIGGKGPGLYAPTSTLPSVIMAQSASYTTPSTSVRSYESEMISSPLIMS